MKAAAHNGAIEFVAKSSDRDISLIPLKSANSKGVMQRLDKKKLLCVIVIAIAAVYFFKLHGWDTTSERPPGIFPVSVSRAGLIFEKTILVIDHNNYYFSLRFAFSEHDALDRARVQKLVGSDDLDKEGKPKDIGVSLPVRLSVSRLDGGHETQVYMKEVDPVLRSWGGDNFSKHIGYAELKPARYVVRVFLLQGTSAFDGTPVAFGIGYDRFKVTFKPAAG